MERKQLKLWLKEYRIPFTCIRFILTYLVFLLIAKYSSVYKTGLIPKELFSTIIVSGLLMYRFLCIAFVPALLFIWITGLFKKTPPA